MKFESYWRHYLKEYKENIRVSNALGGLRNRIDSIAAEVDCRKLASDLIPVASVYAQTAICNESTEEQAWLRLKEAAEASFLAFKIKCISYDLAENKEIAQNWTPNVLLMGLWTLMQISTCEWENACWMSNRLEQGRSDGSVQGWDFWNYPSSRLVVALNRVLSNSCDWDFVDLNLGPYREVFEAWENMEKLKKSLSNCLEYHVQSLSAKSKEADEFDWPPFQLFPAEIIAIKRVRDRLGLETPEIDHPLMQTPLAHPPDEIEEPKNELLEEALAKVRSVAPYLLE